MKKILCLFSALLITLANIPAGIFAANDSYSPELQDAYQFAFKNSITTMDSIDKADMNGGLTRIAMAKMLANYAMNILGKKPANTIVPKFPDVSEKLDDEYNGAVTLAYQLGIMGIGIEKFRPYDLVTRAEFGTALSRMLFGDVDSDPYYALPLLKLNVEGIINNTNPNLQEKRGYVMLMLMRSVGTADDDNSNLELNNKTTESSKINLKIGNEVLSLELENNSATKALIEKLKQGDIVVNAHEYGGFEKVGNLGFDLPRADKQITTEAGDLVLYNGNQVSLFYNGNSWSYTKLGKVTMVNKENLKEVLGDGDVTLTFSLKK